MKRKEKYYINKEIRLERRKLVIEAGSQEFLKYADRLRHTLFILSHQVRLPRRFRRWVWMNEVNRDASKTYTQEDNYRGQLTMAINSIQVNDKVKDLRYFGSKEPGIVTYIWNENFVSVRFSKCESEQIVFKDYLKKIEE